MAGNGFLGSIFGSGKDEKSHKPLPPPPLAVAPHQSASYNPIASINAMRAVYATQLVKMRENNLENITTINARKPYVIKPLESPRFFQQASDEKNQFDVTSKPKIEATIAIRDFIKKAKKDWGTLTQKTQELETTKFFNEKLFVEISRLNLDIIELLQETMVKIDLALKAIGPVTTIPTQVLQSLIHMTIHVDIDLQGDSDDMLFLKLNYTVNKTQEYLSRIMGEINKSANNINSKLALPLPALETTAKASSTPHDAKAAIPVTAEKDSADEDDQFKPKSPRTGK